MRDVLLKIFSATQGSASIELFSFWHFFYLILIIGGSIFGAVLLKNKSENAKDFTLKLLAWLIPAVYIADFMIMPLASSDFSINVDKLPFHVCTLMAFFVPFVQFNKKFKPIEEAVCCLTMAGSLMYLCYPALRLVTFCLGAIKSYKPSFITDLCLHGPSSRSRRAESNSNIKRFGNALQESLSSSYGQASETPHIPTANITTIGSS